MSKPHISGRKITKKILILQLSDDFFCIFIIFLYFCGQIEVKMSKKTLFFVCAALFFAACGPHKPTVAELRQQKRQQDSLSLLQYEQTARYTDSLLQTILPTADSLLARFQYVKNEKYADHGYYIHKQLQTAGLGQRIYLQAYVTDDLKTVVRSMYFGSRALNHDLLILDADSVSNSFAGNLHQYEAEGIHEIVTLNDEDAVQLLRFVSAYSDSKIKVTLSGKGKYAYFINVKDIAALVETLRLQTVMTDIKTLEAQHKQATLQVEKYRRRLI